VTDSVVVVVETAEDPNLTLVQSGILTSQRIIKHKISNKCFKDLGFTLANLVPCGRSEPIFSSTAPKNIVYLKIA
jgi:hypothetical protein